MADEENKKLSKNELKKLAKKAEKDAKKNNGKASDVATDTTSNRDITTDATSAPATSSNNETVYYLANVTSEDCPAALKASIAANAFGIAICRSTASTHTLPSLFTGPALFANFNTATVAFGGNGIAKAIALLTSKGGANLAAVDDWLEFERTSLRKSSPAKEKSAALSKVESALASSSGYFIVGDTLTVADIAIVVTLSQMSSSAGYSSVIQTYLDTHLSSEAFVNGQKALSALVPPPPFDVQNNPSMMQAVNSVFYDAIANLLPHIAHTLGNDKDGLVIEKSKQLKFGDYQCKEAMPLFSQLKASQNLPAGINSPQQLAQAIVSQIPTENPVCDSFEINGPGFILCKVKASYLEHHINKLMNSAEEDGVDPKIPLPLNAKEKGQTVVVDFSSPNIAKEMHVGHLRSTIIGESVCRILELIGANVKRVNHVGDWGTQFGMLITYLKESYPDFANGDNTDVAIADLTQIYKKAKVRLGFLFSFFYFVMVYTSYSNYCYTMMITRLALMKILNSKRHRSSM